MQKEFEQKLSTLQTSLDGAGDLVRDVTEKAMILEAFFAFFILIVRPAFKDPSSLRQEIKPEARKSTQKTGYMFTGPIDLHPQVLLELTGIIII